jgi:hypothetical protein
MLVAVPGDRRESRVFRSDFLSEGTDARARSLELFRSMRNNFAFADCFAAWLRLGFFARIASLFTAQQRVADLINGELAAIKKRASRRYLESPRRDKGRTGVVIKFTPHFHR